MDSLVMIDGFADEILKLDTESRYKFTIGYMRNVFEDSLYNMFLEYINDCGIEVDNIDYFGKYGIRKVEGEADYNTVVKEFQAYWNMRVDDCYGGTLKNHFLEFISNAGEPFYFGNKEYNEIIKDVLSMTYVDYIRYYLSFFKEVM